MGFEFGFKSPKPPKVKGYRPVTDWERKSAKERKAELKRKKKGEKARAKSTRKDKRIARRIWRKLI